MPRIRGGAPVQVVFEVDTAAPLSKKEKSRNLQEMFDLTFKFEGMKTDVDYDPLDPDHTGKTYRLKALQLCKFIGAGGAEIEATPANWGTIIEHWAPIGGEVDVPDVAFGSITGEVEDQQNLVDYIAAKISALVDASPDALNTLNELAAALGDDPNFATTITNSIATKLAKAAISAVTGTAAGDADKVPSLLLFSTWVNDFTSYLNLRIQKSEMPTSGYLKGGAGGVPTSSTTVPSGDLEYSGLRDVGAAAIPNIDFNTPFTTSASVVGTSNIFGATKILLNAKRGLPIRFSIDSKNLNDTLSSTGFLAANGLLSVTLNGAANTEIRVDQVGYNFIAGVRNEIEVRMLPNNIFEVFIDPKV